MMEREEFAKQTARDRTKDLALFGCSGYTYYSVQPDWHGYHCISCDIWGNAVHEDEESAMQAFVKHALGTARAATKVEDTSWS